MELNDHGVHQPWPSGHDMEPAVWFLDNPMHPLLRTLMERGIPAGHRFLVSESEIDDINRIMATLLEAFPGAVQSAQGTTPAQVALLINPESDPAASGQNVRLKLVGPTKDTSTAPKGPSIHVHGLLSGAAGTPYAPMFKQWQASMESADQSPPFMNTRGAYWVTMADVAGAMLRLGRALTSHEGPISICGRRWWTTNDTWEELLMLSSRNAAGLYGTFTPRHLEGGRHVPVHVEALSGVNSSPPQRPDLGTLHSLLVSATGEGWNPSTPLRQGLMMMLAELAERSHS